jgi:hypothetical protein
VDGVDIVDRVDPMDTRHLAILGSTLSIGSTSPTDVSLAAAPLFVAAPPDSWLLAPLLDLLELLLILPPCFSAS